MNLRLFALATVSLCSLALCSLAQQKFSLKQALQTARTNNPFIKTASFNIGIAEQDIVSAKLRPNPILNNQSLQLINSKYYAAGTEFYNRSNRQVWWQLTKPIRLPKQRQYRIELAQQNTLLEMKAYSDLERNLAFDVANQWLDAWTLNLKLELYNQAQSNIDSLLKINQVRLKNLVITQTEVTRTKLIAEQYQLQIKSVKKEFINEIKKLKLLTGSTDSIMLDTNDLSEIIPVANLTLDTLIEQGMRYRTDLQTAKTAVNVTETNINLQKSLASPQPELGMIWNPQNSVPYLGFFGTIQIPIFSRNQGEIGKSQLLRQQAEQNTIAIQQQIITEVQSAYQSYKTEQSNLESYTEILGQSEAVLNSVRYAYVKGGTTIIDFLEAQRTWLDTRQLYYNELLSFRKSYVQLLYSTGLINQLFE